MAEKTEQEAREEILRLVADYAKKYKLPEQNKP